MNRLLLALLTFGLFAPSANAQSTTLNRFEYWFDKDDDDASRVFGTVSGMDVNIPALNINTASLDLGPHNLRFRFQDSQGQWGSVVSRAFIKMHDTPYLITAVRYWVGEELHPSGMQYHYFDMPTDSLNIIDELLDACMFPTGAGQTLKVQVRDNHGQWSSVITRPLNVNPPGTMAITGIEPSGPICAGDTVTFTATPQVGGAIPTGYQWTVPNDNGWSIVNWSGDSIIMTIGSTPGNIIATGMNTCDTSAEFSLPVTVPVAPGLPATSGNWDLHPCAGTNVDYAVLPVSGVHYEWTGAATGSGSTITANIGPDGTITVTPYNACNVPGTPLTETITVQHLPDAPGAITGDFEVCANSSQHYSVASGSIADGGYTWNWQGIDFPGTDDSTTVDFGSASGTLTVTPFNNCGSGTSSEQAITVHQAPDAPVINESGHLCEGDSATLTVNPEPGINYTWTTTETGTSIVVNTPGPYGVTADNGFGCGMTSATIDVVVDSLQLEYVDGPVTIIVAGAYAFTATPSLPAATSYEWIIPASMTWDDSNQADSIAYLHVDFAGSYTVCVVAKSEQCTGDTMCITIDSSVGIAGILSNGADIDIHPNPSNGLFTVVMSAGMGPVDYVVMNALGQVVVPSAKLNGRTTLDLSSLASGSYVMRWHGAHSSGQRTLLVQH